MSTVTSKDGTAIAYEKIGNGPVIILVNGALAHRNLQGEKDLATMLSKKFTVIFYDRRGRGESADTKPYAVEREIEDIEALLGKGGAEAYLYGSSSGAVLSLLATGKLGPQKIKKLALYEPPFVADSPEGKQKFDEEKKTLNDLITAGKPGDAVSVFLQNRGTSPEDMDAMKKSPGWKEMERVGYTLRYDFEVLGDGRIPLTIAKNITIPTQVMVGEKSFDFMHSIAGSLKKVIPNAVRKTLEGQMHEVSPEVLAPVLMEFFAGENSVAAKKERAMQTQR